MAKERRRIRSDAPHEAASLYLESVACRNNLRAVALAGEDGLLVAGTRGGGDFDFNGLAAVGVARARYGSRVPRGVVTTGIATGDRVHTSRIVIGGETFYLTSVGRRRPRARSAEGALGRILGRTFGAALLS